MLRLSITEPLRIATLGGSLANAARLLTPDPREATGVTTASATQTIDIDLGAATSIDTVFLGYANASAYPAAIGMTYGVASYTETTAANIVVAPSIGFPFRHYFTQLAAPVTARYIRLSLPLPAGATFGVLAVGAAFMSQLGHEWGGGRFVTDTGSATRLQGGGFGIDEGVAAGGYQWTFGDLTADETQRLYLIQRNRRTTRTLLVVEDPEVSPGLNERIHWGLLGKLEAYERLDPINTKWSMTINDWL